jgi:hypothetical protein
MQNYSFLIKKQNNVAYYEDFFNAAIIRIIFLILQINY